MMDKEKIKQDALDYEKILRIQQRTPLHFGDMFSFIMRIEASLDYYENKYGFIDSDELEARKYMAEIIKMLGHFEVGNNIMKKYHDNTHESKWLKENDNDKKRNQNILEEE